MVADEERIFLEKIYKEKSGWKWMEIHFSGRNHGGFAVWLGKATSNYF